MGISQAKMKNIGILIYLSVCLIILFIIVEAQPPPPRGGKMYFLKFPNAILKMVYYEFDSEFTD